MQTKAILFDASPLISIAMNGLLHELVKLKDEFPGKFIITKEVKSEIIDRPITIKRFELEALKLQELITDGILEFPESLNISEDEISKKTQEMLNTANNTFWEKGKPVHLIDIGETSILVLSKLLSKQKIQTVLAIDERTTRMLCEKPDNLKKLLQKKLHSTISIRRENLHNFQGFKIVRSSELMFMAYKKNLIRIKNKKVLDAILYALKFKGCAISREEIEILKKI